MTAEKQWLAASIPCRSSLRRPPPMPRSLENCLELTAKPTDDSQRQLVRGNFPATKMEFIQGPNNTFLLPHARQINCTSRWVEAAPVQDRGSMSPKSPRWFQGGSMNLKVNAIRDSGFDETDQSQNDPGIHRV